jgi:hypothetical protein
MSDRPVKSRDAVIALATLAWIILSPVLWAASSDGCMVDCHDMNAEELWTSYVLAVLSLLIFVFGPVVIALLAFRFRNVKAGIIYLAIALVAAALTVPSGTNQYLLTLDWAYIFGGP